MMIVLYSKSCGSAFLVGGLNSCMTEGKDDIRCNVCISFSSFVSRVYVKVILIKWYVVYFHLDIFPGIKNSVHNSLADSLFKFAIYDEISKLRDIDQEYKNTTG